MHMLLLVVCECVHRHVIILRMVTLTCNGNSANLANTRLHFTITHLYIYDNSVFHAKCEHCHEKAILHLILCCRTCWSSINNGTFVCSLMWLLSAASDDHNAGVFSKGTLNYCSILRFKYLRFVSVVSGRSYRNGNAWHFCVPNDEAVRIGCISKCGSSRHVKNVVTKLITKIHW